MKLIKYHYHVLMIRFVLDDGVHTLAYFHKDCNRKCDKNENENNNDDNETENDNDNEK